MDAVRNTATESAMTRGPYTLADLDSFPDDGRRYELANGWLVVSPMARRLHQYGVDAVRQRAAYARIGIPSYWLLDVDLPSVRVLDLTEDATYQQVGYAEGAQAVEVTTPFPVRLVPAELVP